MRDVEKIEVVNIEDTIKCEKIILTLVDERAPKFEIGQTNKAWGGTINEIILNYKLGVFIKSTTKDEEHMEKFFPKENIVSVIHFKKLY